jgi:tRNA pseudouridine55 synthase
MATGVLLICLGQATRVSEYLMAGVKRYRATILLGTTTDTYDAAGKAVATGGRTNYTRAEIEAGLARFTGRIDQVPPMYSALKRDGQPLYKLARQGETVRREPRSVEVYELELVDWSQPSLIIAVTCSSGTYVRALAHDLGQLLGGGAHLAALVRLGSGRFGLEDAVSLERLEEAFQHGQEESYLMAIDEAVLDWPAMIVDSDKARRIAHGQAVSATVSHTTPAGDSEVLCRAYDADGAFLAIMSYHAPSGLWRPKKVFSPA